MKPNRDQPAVDYVLKKTLKQNRDQDILYSSYENTVMLLVDTLAQTSVVENHFFKKILEWIELI